MKKSALFLAVLLAGLFYLGFTFSPSEELPEVYLSSKTLEQGGTLFVKINEEGIEKAEGSLGSKKIYFFQLKNNQGWIGFAGVDASRKPDSYDLKMDYGGKKFGSEIAIKSVNFPATLLATSKELEKIGYTEKGIANEVEKNNDILNKVLNKVSLENYIQKPFIYPLSEIKIVGAFGNIRKNAYSSIQHLGTDLKAGTGTKVFAANDGVAVLAKDLGSSGKTIVIDHGLGLFSLYLHLDNFNVKAGQEVRQGEVIGFSGNTGYSLAPHLHFSIKINGSSVDPLEFVRITRRYMK